MSTSLWRLKPFDVAVLALGAALTLGTAWLVYTGPENGRIVIQGAGGRWIYPPDAQERVVVPGPLGDTVVEIRDGGASILASPCSNQTCVAAGRIGRSGQWAACLPNGVLVRYDGTSASAAANAAAFADAEDGLDAAVW